MLPEGGLIVSTSVMTKSIGNVSLFDISGKCITMRAIDASSFSFDISKSPFGMYFVRLKAGSGAQTMKICLNR